MKHARPQCKRKIKEDRKMNKLIVSSSPHIHTRTSTRGIMLDVIIALLPSVIAGALIFGWKALLVLFATTASAFLFEYLFNLIVKKEQSIGDLTAVVTGLILGLNLKADAPIWQCVIGSAFAIIVVKCLFGGLGCNFANPAATARVFLLISFAGSLGGGALPTLVDAASSATPLQLIKDGRLSELPSFFDLLFGLYGGAIGETCTVAILLGFVYLVIRRVIHFETPLIYIGTVFTFYLIATGDFKLSLMSSLCGGLAFAAVFMITDYVTTPITRSGKMIFAFGCGLITFLIRFYGAYPEGVSFAILLMNIISPYIEKITARKPLGGKK